MQTPNTIKCFKQTTFILLALITCACSVARLPEDMGLAVLNSNDLKTVEDGLPTYLLMVDGALRTYPKNKSLLLAASSLNSAYGGVFVRDEGRKLNMTQKAFGLSEKAICLHNKKTCELRSMPFDAFEQLIKSLRKEKDLPYLYAHASNWTSLIQLTSDDYNSIAELARVELMMKRIVELSPDYEFGMPLVYLGALNSLIPPSLGGKPEKAKAYFDQAIQVSDGKNLIAKVLYAEKYARLLFEQELHDRLLKEVLASPSESDGLTLQNEYAKLEARRLLDESPDYF